MNQLDASRRGSLETSVGFGQGALLVLLAFMTISLALALRLSARERRRAAELASLNSVLETANRSKEQFVAQMSHEFRTPLNAIIGFSEIMRTKAGTPTIERYAAYAGDIHLSAVHLLALVNEILTFSELSEENQPLELDPLELTGVIWNSIRLVEGAYPDRHIDFAGAEKGERIYAMGEDRAVRQIVQNLLTNAAKYAGDAAEISVSLVKTDPDVVGMRVHDTGAGMDRQTLDRVLQPFERNTAGNREFEQVEGVGLGLAICRLLARRMNAELEFETAPGRGFTATLWLKAADKFEAS